ncbi:hypothetical protein [Flyfo myovirus Tbat2_7]|nr:hypothetical protein [Flyfo myovirus Tbat2_7]
MFKIAAENEKWLQSFNQKNDTDYYIGELVADEEILYVDEFGEHYLENAIEDFNNRIAQGKAIWLERAEA